ncbi:MAG: sulfotransferase family 2 domain-containing protein, partial [Acidobacteriota bacterium]
GEERRNGRWFEFQHLTYRELIAFTGFQYQSFRSFAVVRNPYQRFLSDYVWHAAPPRSRFDSIDDFVRRIPTSLSRDWDALIREADQDLGNLLIHIRPQHHYVFDAEGRLLVDHVLHFERLAEDLAVVLEPFGLETTFVRPARERAVSDHLGSGQIARINEIYALDFERFGYERID